MIRIGFVGYFNPKKHPLVFTLATGVLIIAGLFGYSFTRISSLTEELENLTIKMASTTQAFSEETERLDAGITELDQRATELDQKAKELSTDLSAAEQNIRSTKESVASTQSQLGGVAQTVGEISDTVNTLEKLSKTDEELLQKYSKVYFLNEHFVPGRLIEIKKVYLYSERKPEFFHELAWPYLKDLLAGAEGDSMIIYIKSAYRSFNEQQSLKSAYTVAYGDGANQFSADQGYSEHQLGTTVDFITIGLGGLLPGFENTEPYQWLLSNAYKYGFVLSYPQNNQYYIFEPWHWRFIGVKLAITLREQNKNFYDLDQREIDTYLVNIFD